MKLRAQIDEDERIDRTVEAKHKRKVWGARILISAVVIGLLAWGINYYSSWIGQQMLLTRQSLENEVRVMEYAVKFRDAQDLLQVGRFTEAKALFGEISAKDPEYPGLAPAIEQADRMIGLDAKYQEALTKVNLGEMSAALDILQAIEAEEPFYKDVSNRIAEIKGQFFLEDMLAQAEKAYQAQDWMKAASGYETLRGLNPSFQSEVVEEHLFDSYMNVAVATLSEDTQSLEALSQAETYFRKALALRPQDPVIKLERDQARQSFKDRLVSSYIDAAQAAIAEKPDSLDALTKADEYYFKALELLPNNTEAQRQRNLAHLFIEAQMDFDKNRMDLVIEKLEGVISEEPAYAAGTARQTLYEAYISRGDAGLLSGDFDNALSDFQRAAVLAEEGQNAKIRVFQAQIRIAESLGSLLRYEDAVLLYRTAIDTADFSEADLNARPELVTKLRQADGYVQARSYRTAYRLYRDQARKLSFIFPKVTYVVVTGDYLTLIASHYNTTVGAILQANNLSTGQKITAGQQLEIPVQP